jgi:hypothetical protein
VLPVGAAEQPLRASIEAATTAVTESNEDFFIFFPSIHGWFSARLCRELIFESEYMLLQPTNPN